MKPVPVLFCLLFVTLAHGAEPSASPYRLQLHDQQAFKLQIAGDTRTDPPYAGFVHSAAARHNLDPALLHAVIATESAYQADAISPAGATGLMQLMPATARRFGVTDARLPQQNIEGGAAYLRTLLNRYNGNLDLALAAYNAGEGAVEAHGRQIPPYVETRRYVPTVKSRYQSLQRQAGPYRLKLSGHRREVQ